MSRNLIYHISFWILHTLFISVIIFFRAPNFDKVDYVISESLLIFTFYINVLGLRFLIEERKKLKGIFCIFFCLITYCALKYTHRFIFLPAIGHLDFFVPFEWKGFLNDTLYNFTEFLFYAIGFVYAKRFYLSERKALQLQNQKIILENNHLKAQINPHFLYNTLSFIYAKTENSSPEAAQCIYLLTEIMSYALESDSNDGMINLTKEIEHLENYIQLHHLRFANNLNVQFKREINYSDILIPHYSLITFLENAFKHGIVTDPDSPLTILLKINESALIFEIKNKKDNASKLNRLSSSVGLKNIKERLKLIYGERQTVSILETENNYELKLAIQIS